MAPKDVYVLIPGICEYITLHSKRDFVDASFEMGEYSVLSRWPSKIS